MQSNIGTFNRVIISWYINIQPSIVADSTDVELKEIFNTVKKVTASSPTKNLM